MASQTFKGADEATALAAATDFLAASVGKTIESITPTAIQDSESNEFEVCGLVVKFTDGTELEPWAIDASGAATILAFD